MRKHFINAEKIEYPGSRLQGNSIINKKFLHLIIADSTASRREFDRRY
jgi:hypothetical protein